MAGIAALAVIAAVPQFLVDAAAIATALVAICGGAAVLSRLKPVRWLWRNLVSDPVGEWSAKWFDVGASRWHTDHVEPRLASLEKGLAAVEDGVDKANAWGEVLAERAGIPPGTDPREMSTVRNGKH